MRILFGLLLAMSLSGCAALEPEAVTSRDLEVQRQLIFKADVDATFQATKQVFADKGWKLLYEGNEPPRNARVSVFDRDPVTGERYDLIAAWDKSLSPTSPPKKYLHARTPIGVFSYGAQLFVTLFQSPENGSIVSVTAACSQIVERKKLKMYISDIAASLNAQLQ